MVFPELAKRRGATGMLDRLLAARGRRPPGPADRPRGELARAGRRHPRAPRPPHLGQGDPPRRLTPPPSPSSPAPTAASASRSAASSRGSASPCCSAPATPDAARGPRASSAAAHQPGRARRRRRRERARRRGRSSSASTSSSTTRRSSTTRGRGRRRRPRPGPRGVRDQSPRRMARHQASCHYCARARRAGSSTSPAAPARSTTWAAGRPPTACPRRR